MTGPRIPRATRCGPLFPSPIWLRRLAAKIRIATLTARHRQLQRSIDEGELRLLWVAAGVRVDRVMLEDVRFDLAAERTELESLQ